MTITGHGECLQSGCAFYACFGRDTVMLKDVEPREQDQDELVNHADAHGDEHVVEFTEARLYRHALGASPAGNVSDSAISVGRSAKQWPPNAAGICLPGPTCGPLYLHSCRAACPLRPRERLALCQP